MPTPSRVVATYFDENSWNYWNTSWIGSLNLLAKFSGEVVIVDFGIPAKARAFLERLEHYNVVPADKKWDVQELDFIHTLSKCAAKTPESKFAIWNHTCYFQGNIDDVFDLASEKLICCRGGEPQLGVKPFVHTFGYKEGVSEDQDRFLKILKKLARIHNKTIGNGFFAAPAALLPVYDNFISTCIDTGFLTAGNESHQAALNLFAWSYDFLTSVVDDGWCQPITGEFDWQEDGFHRSNKQVKVVHIPADMQYSADSALYHFRNRFAKLHDEWKSYYKGCSFKPKRIMKPSLGKVKKVT